MTPHEQRLHRSLLSLTSRRRMPLGGYLVWEGAGRVVLCFEKSPKSWRYWILGPLILTAFFAGLLVVVGKSDWLFPMGALSGISLVVAIIGVQSYLSAPALEEIISCGTAQDSTLDVAMLGASWPKTQLHRLALRKVRDVNEDDDTEYWVLYAHTCDDEYLPIHLDESREHRRTGMIASVREFCRRAGLELLEPPSDSEVAVPYI